MPQQHHFLLSPETGEDLPLLSGIGGAVAAPGAPDPRSQLSAFPDLCMGGSLSLNWPTRGERGGWGECWSLSHLLWSPVRALKLLWLKGLGPRLWEERKQTEGLLKS